MQTFLLPKALCSQMDNAICIFWWGFKDHKRHLHLKAWDFICSPKYNGGLGFRKFLDMNTAFITKLAWKVCIEQHRTWVQLIRSKYLRGRRILDLQHSQKPASWVWSEIKSCYNSLRKGICYKIGQDSLVHTYKDPWLADLPHYTIPTGVPQADALFYVRHLMTQDGKEWNNNVIQANFSPSLYQSIISTPISQGEQDTYVWIPSKAGKFMIRSSYRANIEHRLNPLSDADKQKWKVLWQSTLHERHKLFLWKIMVNILPTKDRIKCFVPLSNLNCLLCGQEEETIQHLFLECPVSIQCWGEFSVGDSYTTTISFVSSRMDS